MQMSFNLRTSRFVSALDGRCGHFESPVLDVLKWLITLLCVSFLNNFILKLDLAAIKVLIYTFLPH